MVLWSRGVTVMTLCYAPMVTPPVDLELLGHPGVELGILAAWTVELNFTGIQLNQLAENLEVGPNSQHMRNINVQALLEK